MYTEEVVQEAGYTEYGYRGLEEIRRLEELVKNKNEEIDELRTKLYKLEGDRYNIE